ncbi:MAG: hypothetical protein RLZZ500_1751 [Bacteroidota bacterium]|jgi:hypothetical protein
MKKTITLLVLGVGLWSNAQTEPMDLVAKETCECVTKKKAEGKITKEELTLSVGLCLLASYDKYKDKFPKEEQISMTDENAAEKLGEKVAMKMVTYCPETILEIGMMSQDEENAEADAEPEYETIEGTITAIEVKQFVTIKMKDKNGKQVQFLLLDYFETASVYTDGKLKVNDKVAISYGDVELYDPIQKEFRTYKVITALKKN